MTTPQQPSEPRDATQPQWPADLLAGRVAVVTGGGGAIGASLCRLLARTGCTVVCADIDATRVATVVDEVRQAGARAEGVAADLTTADGVTELYDRTAGAFGDVDILVNGLGEHLASAGRFEDGTEQLWQDLYEVNLLHVLRATKAFLPGMRARGWGRIINFSSVEGIRAAPALAVYTAFKRAVDGFTKSLAVDVARDGVLVNAIAVDKTRAYQTDHYRLPEEYARLAGVWIPAGRYAEPEDVARLALFLVSPWNTWVVGQTVAADGGTLSAGGWYRTPKRWTNQPLLAQYLEDPDVNEGRPPAVQ